MMEVQAKKQKRIKDLRDEYDRFNLNKVDYGFGTQDLLSYMEYYLFPLSESDLVDIDNEKSYSGYYAFNVPIPSELIKEAVLLAKKSDNNLSRMVLNYPYIQLIVEYWIINKIYRLCISNPKLIGASSLIKDYKSFNKYLSYHYLPFEEYAKNPAGSSNDGYTATFESMAGIICNLHGKPFRTLSFKKESGYSDTSKELIYNIADMGMAADDLYRNTDFTLYDFIYDLFYNGVCKTFRASFQNGMIMKYIPIYNLPKSRYSYKEINFESLYGDWLERKFYPNIDRKVTRLECSNPKLQAEESLIVKSLYNEFAKKHNGKSYTFQNDFYNPKLGPGYNELWEICGRAIEHAKANKNGNTDLYKKWFYAPTVFPSPPEFRYTGIMLNADGDYIEVEGRDTYTYKEMEELTGQKFYFTHNFHVETPCFYKRRMFWGYEWDRMHTLSDVDRCYMNNDLFSSLYYKYTGLQLTTLLFISAYGRW